MLSAEMRVWNRADPPTEPSVYWGSLYLLIDIPHSQDLVPGLQGVGEVRVPSRCVFGTLSPSLTDIMMRKLLEISHHQDSSPCS